MWRIIFNMWRASVSSCQLRAGLALAGRTLSGGSRRIATWAGPALVFVLAVLSWNLTSFYRDGETLYRETLARNPDSWLAHSNLGSVLMHVARLRPR